MSEVKLTPVGELAAATITSCVTCRGRHWCPSCEDRRDELATAIEAIVTDRLAAADATVARVRERMDRLAADQRAAMEMCGTFESHMVGAINLYSDACDDIRAALGGGGGGMGPQASLEGPLSDDEGEVALGDVGQSERLSGPQNGGMA